MSATLLKSVYITKNRTIDKKGIEIDKFFIYFSTSSTNVHPRTYDWFLAKIIDNKEEVLQYVQGFYNDISGGMIQFLNKTEEKPNNISEYIYFRNKMIRELNRAEKNFDNDLKNDDIIILDQEKFNDSKYMSSINQKLFKKMQKEKKTKERTYGSEGLLGLTFTKDNEKEEKLNKLIFQNEKFKKNIEIDIIYEKLNDDKIFIFTDEFEKLYKKGVSKLNQKDSKQFEKNILNIFNNFFRHHLTLENKYKIPKEKLLIFFKMNIKNLIMNGYLKNYDGGKQNIASIFSDFETLEIDELVKNNELDNIVEETLKEISPEYSLSMNCDKLLEEEKTDYDKRSVYENIPTFNKFLKEIKIDDNDIIKEIKRVYDIRKENENKDIDKFITSFPKLLVNILDLYNYRITKTDVYNKFLNSFTYLDKYSEYLQKEDIEKILDIITNDIKYEKFNMKLKDVEKLRIKFPKSMHQEKLTIKNIKKLSKIHTENLSKKNPDLKPEDLIKFNKDNENALLKHIFNDRKKRIVYTMKKLLFDNKDIKLNIKVKNMLEDIFMLDNSKSNDYLTINKLFLKEEKIKNDIFEKKELDLDLI